MAYLTTDETRQLGLNVTRLCADRKWSQEDLARVSGLSVSTIRKMRRARHSAQERTLRSIAVALDVADAGELLRPWDSSPLAAAFSEPPVPRRAANQAQAQAQFNLQVAELMRVAARAYRDDPQTGDRIYIQLTGRVRQMTQAVRADASARNRNGVRNR